MEEKTKKNDFIEIEFTAYANGDIFDSNVAEELKKINKEAKPEKLIIVIGQDMVVKGLEKSLEDKELNKDYEVSFPAKEGFGERDRNLLRTIPLSKFTEQKINPQPGMVLALDDKAVKIVAVSGARVTADFNNPLSGKDIKYKFKILRKVTDKKEKAETLFKFFFRFLPKYEIKENKVFVKLPKGLESLIDPYKKKFKELAGLDLEFQELKEEDKKKTEEPKEEKKEEKTEEKPKEADKLPNKSQEQ